MESDGTTPVGCDLAPPASDLVPRFPVPANRTEIVLYAGEPGELWLHWYLHADDLATAGAGFPAAEGQPAPVLRVLRVRGEGMRELVAERRPRLAGPGGGGQTGFSVGPDPGAFEAELGLNNGGGGWLLLARSNRFVHAAGIGLDVSVSGPGEDATRSSDPTLECPKAQPKSGSPFIDPATSVAQASSVSVGEGLGSRDAVSAGEGGGVSLAPLAGAAEPGEGPIPVSLYGRPVVPAPRLQIEAELRIRGWAAPNSEIDLFGYPYRVGPGGRFELVLKVEDPALLTQALALHPPAELGLSRDD